MYVVMCLQANSLVKNLTAPRSARYSSSPESQRSEPSEEGLYDVLYRSDEDDEEYDIPFTGGIQAAVNALRVALKHPSMRLIQRPATKQSSSSTRATGFDDYSDNIKVFLCWPLIKISLA
jgi:hypothetical protein